MCAEDKTDDLSALLKTGYGAPPPREEFVRDLAQRMRKEFVAQRDALAAPPPRRVSAIRWSWAWAAAAAAAVILLTTGGITWMLTHPGGGTPNGSSVGIMPGPEPTGTPEEQMVPLNLKLPKAQFIGTEKNFPPSSHLEPYTLKPRPLFMVPEGTVNLALGKPVTAGDPITVAGELKQITDGCKEGDDTSCVDLGGPGTQWVQIDLKEPCAIYAVVVWHYHAEARVYHDVVVQAADDPDFIENVRTVYNNDYDNSSGLGVGKDLEYIEDYRGRLIDTRGPDGKGVKARYVRLYSRGNSSDELNHYVEVEVCGKPAAAAPAAPPAAAAPAAPPTAPPAPKAK